MPPHLDFQRWIDCSATRCFLAKLTADDPASRALRIEMACSFDHRLRFM